VQILFEVGRAKSFQFPDQSFLEEARARTAELTLKHLSAKGAISLAMISVVVSWQATSGRAEERRPCIVAQDIKRFCSSRSTVSYIAKVPQASKWLTRFVKTPASGFGLYENAKDIPDQCHNKLRS
jgi:hypothetical protein